MLDTLRSIVQDVNAAPTFRHALDVIVARVRVVVPHEQCVIGSVPAASSCIRVAHDVEIAQNSPHGL